MMDKTAKKSIRKRNISRIKRQSRWRLYAAMFIVFVLIICAAGRIIYLNVNKGTEYKKEVLAQQSYVNKVIPYKRGDIVDKNGNTLAKSTKVYDLIIEPKQILDADKDKKSDDYKKATAAALEKIFGIKESTFYKILSKKPDSMYYPMKKYTQLSRKIVEQFKELSKDNSKIIGVWFEEKYLRTYPYSQVASTVLGFCSSDGQGLGGIESWYNSSLNGVNGKSFGYYDSNLNLVEEVKEAQNGNTVVSTIDINVQGVLEKKMKKFQEETGSENMGVILMNPQNGEILSMVNVPEFNLNDPFELNTGEELEGEKLQDALNAMWRNRCINDTYEPGSTFKIITSAACLEEGVVTPEDTFSCPGYRMVEDRRIRCHKVGGHGSETFVQGIQNSCNPVFIDIGLRLGAERFYDYFQQFGLLDLTGIDLPGEAGTIMHQVENIGLVELATISFGQSFQVTPVQMAVTVSSIINGGRRVTPHFGKAVLDREGNVLETLSYEERSGVVSEKTSKTMQTLLEGVVANGSGKNAYIEGYSIGGKTATSQTLPRSANKYISSFIGFAPAEDPQVLGMVVIHNPQGIYYGGTIAAPVLRSIFDNVLPYLGIEKQ